MPPLLAFELPAFLLGLLFGSFLNVCISRLPWHQSISTPRSHCPRCQHPIRWYDNIPLLSWVVLRAKCRDCGATIPWRYPLVELGTALWFMNTLGVFWVRALIEHNGQVGLWMEQRIQAQYFAGGAALILGFLLIGLLVMDWQTHTLPDAFTLTGIVLGFLLVCTQAIFLPTGAEDIHLNPTTRMRMRSPGSFIELGNVAVTGPEHLVFGRVFAILGAAAILWSIRAGYKAVRHREGLGLGDVKLLAMIAAFLGFWPAVLALFAGCLLILPWAAYLLATKKADQATQLPFGSFLCAGGLIAAIAGEPIIAWYSHLL